MEFKLAKNGGTIEVRVYDRRYFMVLMYFLVASWLNSTIYVFFFIRPGALPLFWLVSVCFSCVAVQLLYP